MTKKFVNMIARMIGLIAFTLAVGNVSADDFEWAPITESDWAVAEDSSLGLHDAVMIFEKVTADDREAQKKKCFRTVYRRLRILSSVGRDQADVEADFFHLDQKVVQVLGRTVLPDGTVRTLEPGQIFEKEVVKTEGEEYTQTTFSLPGVTDDCIIEYLLVYKLPRIHAEWIVQKDIGLLNAELRWILAELNVSKTVADVLDEMDVITPNYLWLNTFSRVQMNAIPDKDEPEELVFTLGFTPAFLEEPHTVADASLRSKGYVYYGSKKTSSMYWGEWAAGLAGYQREFCEKDGDLKSVVSEFEQLPTIEEKIKAAYIWVQQNILNTTYQDLYDPKDVDKKKKKTPKDNESVRDVLKHGYGTRTDIDRLFCAMLQRLGVDTKMVFAKDRFDDLFVPEAKLWQFDRSLVVIVEGRSQYRFCSPGFPLIPYDMVPWFVEGVDGLLVGADDFLWTIPFSEAEKTKSERDYAFTVDDQLAVQCRVSMKSTGHEARGLRMTVFEENEGEYQKLLSDEIKEDYSDAELDSVSWESLWDIDAPLGLGFVLSYPRLTEQGDRIFLKPFDFLSDAENPFFASERKNAMLFPYAGVLNEEARFLTPAGWAVEGMPQDTSYKNLVGACSVSFRTTNDTLTVQRHFTLKAPFWSPKDYRLVRRLFQMRQDFSDLIVILKREVGEGSDL